MIIIAGEKQCIQFGIRDEIGALVPVIQAFDVNNNIIIMDQGIELMDMDLY